MKNSTFSYCSVSLCRVCIIQVQYNTNTVYPHSVEIGKHTKERENLDLQEYFTTYYGATVASVLNF